MELFINRNNALSKMTQDEEKEYAQLENEVETEIPEAIIEKRINTLEGVTDDLVLMMADLIGGEN